MGRTGKNKGAKEGSQYVETPLYSREDIREQYCINKKEVDVLDRSSHMRRAKGFFGCLTSRKDPSSKKKKRSSFFAALCVRRASEENLYNGCNKPVANTNRSVTLPALQPFTVPLRDDGSNQSSLFRNRPQSFCTTDPRRFSIQSTTAAAAPAVAPATTSCIVNNYPPARHTDPDWKFNTLPIQRTVSDAHEEHDTSTSNHPFRYGGRLAYTQPNTPELSAALYRRQVMSSEALLDDRRSTGSVSKHVSFDASSPCSEIYTSAVPANASKSQERLLDGRKTPEPFIDPKSSRHHQTAAFSPVLARAILLERLRQASMRSQATQTEGYYNSTTSLSYPSCYSGAESQVSIPGAVCVSTVTRQVQTNFEPRSSASKRLTRSSSAVNQESDDGDRLRDDDFPIPLSRRSDELSQSQPEEIGDYKKSSPGRASNSSAGSRRTRSNRRRQLLKALSEGTILLDRKRARRFASGYVEVNVQDGRSSPTGEEEEEMVAGRVLVHDPRFMGSGSSDDGSFNEEELFTATTVPNKRPKDAGTNRSPCFSDDDDAAAAAGATAVAGAAAGWSDTEYTPQPFSGEAEESKLTTSRTLQAQKSLDSNASLPDTAGNYSDEFGSTSQVTILQSHPPSVVQQQQQVNSGEPSYVVTCDSDFDQHPPTPPPRRSTATTTTTSTATNTESSAAEAPPPPLVDSAEQSETEKEIMVAFPPWPGAQDAELIPAPPSFASSSNPPSLPSVDYEPEDDELPPPPPPPPDVLPSPNKQMSERVLLRHLKHGSKSMSETITSVDSDSSGRRVTEHETSASSEPLSPTSDDVGNSPLNSPPQVEVTNDKPSAGVDSGDSSDPFLTALSDHLTTAGLTEVFNTAMEKSERSFRESDTSHNSTLRMDQSGVQDLPYEPPPPPARPNDDGPTASLPPPPAAPPLLTSPDSNNEGPEYCRESSTSGSYSLEATPCASLSPVLAALPSPLEIKGSTSSTTIESRKEAPLESLHPRERPSAHPEGEAAAAAAASAVATATTDRKTMKEGMKLQFTPGATMFSSGLSPSSAATPSGSRPTGRRKHFHHQQQQQQQQGQLSSTDSDDNDGERSLRNKRRNNNGTKGNTSADSSLSAAYATDSMKRVSAKHKKSSRNREVAAATTPSAEGGARKRDSGQVEATTPGMVRSPAMHEGFRITDWISRHSPSHGSPPPPIEPTSADASFFILQHPSESSSQDPDFGPVELRGGPAPWSLMAPATSHHQNCDSIRSASPGSDNVFVSETVDLPGSNGVVVKPPEGFADSPATLNPDWSLPSPTVKNNQFPPSIHGSKQPLDAVVSGGGDDGGCCGGDSNGNDGKRKRDSGRGKRTKSCTLPAGNLSSSGLSLEAPGSPENQGPLRAVSTIDMWYPETQLPPKRQLTVRAKSEERDRWNRPTRRSVETSWDSLGSKLSCDGTPLDDEDAGIYNASYRAGAWAYIGETEELQVWRRSQPQTPLQETDDSSTASEKDFRRKYTSITHRMVHRKSSVEMFRRLATSTFECDDIVLVKRESGEFGFRIHGSRPVVVSAIEPGTPAEVSGLQVGDILISINDVNVLDSSHSEVVRIAHAGTDELKLEVARTCNVLAANPTTVEEQPGKDGSDGNNEAPILVGYLWKKSQSASRAEETSNIWYRRWFVLKRDNCLYYYKKQDSSQPLGAVSLLHYTVTRTSFTERPHGLLLSKGGTIRHWLAADSTESVELWHSVFNHASKAAVQDVWLEMCTQNIQLPPASMASPDCVGHLMKLGHRAKEWQRRFCLLKDACLFFYVDINVSSALGALHLHGYRVQASGTTASSGERRKFAFELLPPEPRMRHFHFYTDSENDRKRWIAALEYSIDRWIRVG